MENILTVRFDEKLNLEAISLVKEHIAGNIGMTVADLFETVEGEDDTVTFTYDDEIGGEIIMVFGEDERSAFIKISSDYCIDMILIYELMSDVLKWEEV